jgi:pectinesterase
MKKYLSFLFSLMLVLSLTSGRHQTTIFVIGDSTAAQKANPGTNPERGWGMVLQGFFDQDIIVENHAVNGRSSKSFIDEGRWQTVLRRIKPGDYVFIQFGHNDEKADPARHTDVGSTFDANLSRYVRETRAKGGNPVLFSCVVRRNFYNEVDSTVDDESLRNVSYGDEQINSDTLVDTHGAYKDVPRMLARQSGVPFIDANKITHDLEQRMGVVESRRLHMWFRPGEIPSIPQGRKDNTHYNVYGAHVVARLLAQAVGRTIKPLRRHVVDYDIIVSDRGRGNYMSMDKALTAARYSGIHRMYVLDGRWTVSRRALSSYRVRFVCYPGASVTMTR